jgi:hypothetical protein
MTSPADGGWVIGLGAMTKVFDESAIDFDAWVDAMAPVLGFNVTGLDREAVKANLRVIAGHAASVEEFPLPDEAEPAPIFCAEDRL